MESEHVRKAINVRQVVHDGPARRAVVLSTDDSRFLDRCGSSCTVTAFDRVAATIGTNAVGIG